MQPYFSIGALSKQTGCSIDTIRYYERKELLPRAARSMGGHRIYDESSVRRVRFVMRARALGFTVKETHILLNLVEQSSACQQAEDYIHEHIDLVDRKIRELEAIRLQLERLAASCESCGGCACAIESLAN